MLKYFNKLPKGEVAEPMPVLVQQATVAATERRKVGWPPLTKQRNNKSKIGEITTSNNVKELAVAEKILIDRCVVNSRSQTVMRQPLLLLRNINRLRKLCSLAMVRIYHIRNNSVQY